MKLTRTQTIAAAVAGTIAVVGAGTAIHAASVHEQNCLSYERQLLATFNTQSDLLTEGIGIVYQINQNPFAAFGFIGRMGSFQAEVAQSIKKENDLVYAYAETCGGKRLVAWSETKPVADKLEQIKVQKQELNSFQF